MTGTLRLTCKAKVVTDAESGILLDIGHGRYFALSITARDICIALESGTSRDALIAMLGSRYASAPEDLSADCDAFLSKLQHLELCEIVAT